MTFYLAAPFPQIEMVRHVRDDLLVLDHRVTSRWLDEKSVLSGAWALADLEDLDAADVVVIFNDPDWIEKGTGGRHTELGYAIAREKRILLIGQRSQIFHYHPRVRQIDDLGIFFLIVDSLEKDPR